MENPDYVAAALKVYEQQKKAQARYYDAHREEIRQKKKEQYREKHPEPRPVGRPRKATPPPPSETDPVAVEGV